MTKLIEFKNLQGETLRALFDKTDSDMGVIFVHGFERTTIESKFKNINDSIKGQVNTWRFDFSGTGLSDGKFEDFSIKKVVDELSVAIEAFQVNCPQVKKLCVVGHSIAGCIILQFLAETKGDVVKLVLLAPAFNQKTLLRYWFTRSQYKDKNITWDNYSEYLDEDEFIKDTEVDNRMIKEHYLSNNYWLENRDRDYQILYKDIDFNWESMLLIHGLGDNKVPLASNDKLPADIQTIEVENGDHDLQRPDMVEQYLDKVINFILDV